MCGFFFRRLFSDSTNASLFEPTKHRLFFFFPPKVHLKDCKAVQMYVIINRRVVLCCELTISRFFCLFFFCFVFNRFLRPQRISRQVNKKRKYYLYACRDHSSGNIYNTFIFSKPSEVSKLDCDSV